jgi:DNA modification methylase
MEKLDYIQAIDCLEGLKQLPNECIQCCVTSPPYYRLRDYGMDGQVGMEDTPEAYLERIGLIFDEVRRVLKNDGTLWLNLGDSYWGSDRHPIIKSKDLIGIPWAAAFALRERGWWLRQDIVWSKKNCMPESITDRCTRSHEYIFMLSKSATYYYNAEAIKTDIKESSLERAKRARSDHNKYSQGVPGNRPQAIHKPREPKKQDGHGIRHEGFNERWNKATEEGTAPVKVNRRSVWELSTKPFKESHFATFPIEIPRLCILAGSKEKDIILDPFSGAGTTALVAASLGRHYVGFELNPRYVKIANGRLKNSLGLFYTGE